MEDYLNHLVNLYPVSSNQKSVLRALNYVQDHLQKRGLLTTHLPQSGIHNLYASTGASRQSKILLQAHIDVVPSQKQRFIKSDTSYCGRGSYDMLFAVACYMRLCDELEDQLPNLDIAFMFSGDEELGGFNGVKPFLEKGYSTDICILPDAGQGFGTLNVAAKGIYNCTIRIHGRSHHGSRPWEGDGAAIKLVHFLAKADQIFDRSSQDNSSMTVAKLEAGHADNQGPAYADAILDIRYCDQKDLRRIKQNLKHLLGTFDGEVIRLTEGGNYTLDTYNLYVKQFVNLYEKHNNKPIVFVKAHGSSDARFFAEKNIPVIMLRPDGGGAHGDEEWISLESIEKFYQLLKEFVLIVATIEPKGTKL